MKCKNCRAYWETNTDCGYENGCYLDGFIEKSDNYEYTEDGCTIHHKTIKKLIDENEKQQNNYYEDYAEWYQTRCNTIETCVICGEKKTGDKMTTCNGNHNTVSEPCGQKICYDCWERERSESIYNGIVPKCCRQKTEEL